MDARTNFANAEPMQNVLDRSINYDLLITQHKQLLNRIARSVFVRTSNSIPVEDLVHIGVIALLQAAAVFEDRGVAQFSSYAATRIRGAMLDELRRSATISRQALRNRRRFESTRRALTTALGKPPSDAEMATQLGMTVEAYRAADQETHSLRYDSIETEYSDHNLSFADNGPDAFECLEQDRRRDAMAAAIARLPRREALILQLFFVDELSLDEIGKTLDVSASRVCQIKKQALEMIRKRLTGWH